MAKLISVDDNPAVTKERDNKAGPKTPEEQLAEQQNGPEEKITPLERWLYERIYESLSSDLQCALRASLDVQKGADKTTAPEHTKSAADQSQRQWMPRKELVDRFNEIRHGALGATQPATVGKYLSDARARLKIGYRLAKSSAFAKAGAYSWRGEDIKTSLVSFHALEHSIGMLTPEELLTKFPSKGQPARYLLKTLMPNDTGRRERRRKHKPHGEERRSGVDRRANDAERKMRSRKAIEAAILRCETVRKALNSMDEYLSTLVVTADLHHVSFRVIDQLDFLAPGRKDCSAEQARDEFATGIEFKDDHQRGARKTHNRRALRALKMALNHLGREGE
jgi:hypothetical protein